MNSHYVVRGRAYTEFLFNFIVNILSVRIKLRKFRPLVTNFYVTKECNLRCRYCYPPGDEPSLPTGNLLDLMEKIRPHNPVINFTGGEPLMRQDMVTLLKKARELRFYPIILSTNGLLFERTMDAMPYIDHLILSLDSLDPVVNDKLGGVRGSSEVIIQNIRRYASRTGEMGVHMSLHSVLTPENLEAIEPIVEFCEALKISLSLSPEHDVFDPNPGLRNNPAYRSLIGRLIGMKNAGRPIACSYGYLRTISDFSEHSCFPFLSPRVESDGRVYFPCQRIAARKVYLQDYPDLATLMRMESEWIAHTECPRRCFLACYIDVENYIRHPLALLEEPEMKKYLFGRRRKAAA